MLLSILPSESPYRVDQVMAAPGLMASLFGLQILLASILSWLGSRKPKVIWWTIAIILLGITSVFFALGSWGTTDVTKLSYWMKDSPGMGINGEPFWHLIAPLIPKLPYRMAAVHGLVAGAYGFAAIFLARSWQVPAWGGWWCLFLTASPILRGFLQNGQTRQALAALLMLPLMLWAANLMKSTWTLIISTTAWSAICHTTFPINLIFSLAPGLVKTNQQSILRIPSRVRLPLLMFAVIVMMILITMVGPVAMEKLNAYTNEIKFFSHYAVRREVLQLEGTMLLAVLLTAWLRNLRPRVMLSCERSRVLGLYAMLFVALQASVEWEWWPQITFRLADVAGLFLLISFLAWLCHYRALPLLLPALTLTLHYWFFTRIQGSAHLACGRNDEFLCIPDRWPAQVHY
jgi:hypothetical protein